jgi:hypothetical protein
MEAGNPQTIIRYVACFQWYASQIAKRISERVIDRFENTAKALWRRAPVAAGDASDESLP